MKIRFTILLSALMALSASAATVTGTVQTSFGIAYSPWVRFIPKSTPQAVGNATVWDVPQGLQPDTNGNFTATNVVGGFYDVDPGTPNKPLRILVPFNDTNTYTLNYCAQLAINASVFAGSVSQIATISNLASMVAPLAPTNYVTAAISNAGVDLDAAAYVSAVNPSMSPTVQQRIQGGFIALKSSGIWPNLIDAGVLGTNVNLGGSTFTTLKLRTGTTVGSPTVLDYGIQFNGTSQYAYLRGLPDTRTNTLIVIFEKSGSPAVADGAIISYQNSGSINGTEGISTDNGYPVTAAMGIFSYFRDVYPATYTNAVFPYISWHSTSLDNRMVGNDPMEHTLALSTDNHGILTHWTDGYSYGSTNVGFGIASSLTSLNIGVACLGDGNPFSATYYKGVVKAFALIAGPASTNQVRAAMTALRWFDLREENYVFVGDSQTTPIQDFRLNQNWPYQMMNLTSRSNTAFWRNVAINGTMAGQWPAWYPTYVQQFKPGGPVKKSTIFYRLGPNDILTGGMDAPTTLASMSNFWTTAKQDGFKINAFTLTPATNYTWAPGKEAVRQQLNSMIASNGLDLVDKVYRMDLVWSDPGPATWWTYDSLHQNAAGYHAIANMVAGNDTPVNMPFADPLTLYPTNRVNFYPASTWIIDSSQTRLNPNSPSAAPQNSPDGTSAAGNAAVITYVSIPEWVTNVSGQVYVQCTGTQAWTNSVGIQYFSPTVGRIIPTQTSVPTFGISGLNTVTWTNISVIATNCPHVFRVFASTASTNASTFYWIGPMTLIFN